MGGYYETKRYSGRRKHMNKGMPDNTEDSGTNRFYYGTRAELKPGHLIEPGKSPNVGEQDSSYVYLTSDLDPAIWEAEVADGEGPGRVYTVQPIGRVEDDPDRTKSPGIPMMTLRSHESLRV